MPVSFPHTPTVESQRIQCHTFQYRKIILVSHSSRSPISNRLGLYSFKIESMNRTHLLFFYYQYWYISSFLEVRDVITYYLLAVLYSGRYTIIIRSEERRVGKECRYRWSRY